MKRRNQIEIVPVWRERVDHRLYVLALLAFAKQLAREETAIKPKTAARGHGGEAHHD
jgi:hypothetical protein